MMERKPLAEWKNNDWKEQYTDCVIQDRFLDLNFIWFMDQMENIAKNNVCKQAKQRCIDALREIYTINEASRIKDVVCVAYDLICAGKSNENKELGCVQIRRGCDTLYDMLILPFDKAWSIRDKQIMEREKKKEEERMKKYEGYEKGWKEI